MNDNGDSNANRFFKNGFFFLITVYLFNNIYAQATFLASKGGQ